MSNILVIFQTKTLNKETYNFVSFMSSENSITSFEAINICLNGLWKNSYIADNFDQLNSMLEEEIVRTKIKRQGLILDPVQIMTIPCPFVSIGINSESNPVSTLCKPVNLEELFFLTKFITQLL